MDSMQEITLTQGNLDTEIDTSELDGDFNGLDLNGPEFDSPLFNESDLNLSLDTNPEITRVVSKAAGNNRQRKKVRTREKIAKLVAEGAKNYPAYLKLVHTGDSDFSDSDHEMERVTKAKQDEIRARNIKEQFGNWESKWEVTSLRSKKERLCVDIKKTEQWIKTPDTPGEEKKDPTKATPTGDKPGDENFFDTSDVASPEYENAVNQDMIDPNISAEERERQRQEYQEELAKLEDEITTLRQVLSAKVRQASELKRKLGITPMVELRQDLKQGFQNIKESDAYKKTNETLSEVGQRISSTQAYQKTNETIHKVGEKVASTNAYQKTSATLKTAGTKTSSAFSTFGAFTSKKLGEVRNSKSFKSFEEKIGGAYSNVKGESQELPETKVRGSQSEQNFEDVLSSTVDGGDTKAASVPATPADEKVPL